VVGHLDAAGLADIEQRSMSSVAEPATLGLWAFATGTWIAGVVIAGVFQPAVLLGAAPVLLVFAGLTQFIAGLLAIRRANTLAATAFTCFGAFNVITAFALLLQGMHLVPMTGDPMVFQGYLLLSFGLIALILTLAALRTNLALVLVLLTLGAGYTLTGVAYVTGAVTSTGGLSEVGHIGGYLLILSAGIAYYTGAAMVCNASFQRELLPLGGEP
jgi:succinate-acetate transporter protein